ncbi:UNKNOWN [Stylonychia lemnae]|uniref:Uncharacterized protein n=1 Tax=Stylonychia lemnae TaxID=5949 RepID=A0A078AIA4_STYLE|nr:UNKNOWN [Stylonychia lemnae]|eukprot:CDW81666.1 UNKNOWN [Stylonychia lemnae]
MYTCKIPPNCKDCPCGSGSKGYMVCLYRESCKGTLIYCDDEPCGDLHSHKFAIIGNVMASKIINANKLKEEWAQIEQRICGNYEQYEYLIKYYSNGMKTFNLKTLKNPQDQPFTTLDEANDIIDQFYKTSIDYVQKLEELSLECELEKMIQLEQDVGVLLLDQFNKVKSLGVLDPNLIWLYYQDLIAMDYDNLELKEDFTTDNWHVFHSLQDKSFKKALKESKAENFMLNEKIQKLVEKVDSLIYKSK